MKNNQKHLITYIRNLLKDKGYILIDNEYINSDTKITFLDKSGYKYYGVFKHIKDSHNPRKFSIYNKYTIDNIKLWIKLNNKPFTLLSSTYVNSEEKLLFKCKICDNEFLSNWGHIYSGRGCRECQYIKVGNIKSTATKDRNLLLYYPKLCEEWDYENNNHNPEYYLPSSNKKVFWRCSKCNNEWKATISHRVHMKSGCPKCHCSKAENEIEQILQENKIKFKREYIFKNCKYEKNLRFDFFLPKYNICIEYDGEAHFMPVRFGGIAKCKADINFKKQQIRDNIKNQYCFENNINLIRIPYSQRENIKNILFDCLN